MNTSDSRQDRQHGKGISLEKYLLMNETEKDLEIQKAVARLQKRIQEIVYLLDIDNSHLSNSEHEQKKSVWFTKNLASNRGEKSNWNAEKPDQGR